MSTDENKTSREIERDVEQTRAGMTETLDELKARMSPGQMLDEVLGYARESGGGKMMQNLGRTIQDNPAPLLLIGAGVAWMMATGGSHHDERWYRPADGGDHNRELDGSTDLASRAGSIGESVGDSVRHAGERVTSTIASMADTTSDFVDGLRDSATRTMHDIGDNAHRTGGSAYHKTRDVGGNVLTSLQDQPFVLAALGIALGAALGAALPETHVEDSVMGEASDALKEKASEGYEKAKAVAKKTVDKASDEAKAQGLGTDSAEGALRDLGSKAGAVFDAAKDAAIDEASRQGLTGDLEEDLGRGLPSEGSRHVSQID
jgi:ElaB/YqjD/DUF883 family membrane-anchored ribosome-binding protein